VLVRRFRPLRGGRGRFRPARALFGLCRRFWACGLSTCRVVACGFGCAVRSTTSCMHLCRGLLALLLHRRIQDARTVGYSGGVADLHSTPTYAKPRIDTSIPRRPFSVGPKPKCRSRPKLAVERNSPSCPGCCGRAGSSDRHRATRRERPSCGAFRRRGRRARGTAGC
jgi:hypothetical protein